MSRFELVFLIPPVWRNYWCSLSPWVYRWRIKFGVMALLNVSFCLSHRTLAPPQSRSYKTTGEGPSSKSPCFCHVELQTVRSIFLYMSFLHYCYSSRLGYLFSERVTHFFKRIHPIVILFHLHGVEGQTIQFMKKKMYLTTLEDKAW